jgi:hypothetical protein
MGEENVWESVVRESREREREGRVVVVGEGESEGDRPTAKRATILTSACSSEGGHSKGDWLSACPYRF